MGFFSFFSKEKKETLDKGLSKTKESVFGKIARAVAGKSKVDDEVLDNLEEVLITSDVGVETTLKIIERIEKRAAADKYMNATELNHILRDEIAALLTENNSEDVDDFEAPIAKKPYVIMVVGVNGVGKTTTIGKLAYQFKKAGKSVYLGAADTFRAAAVEQLVIWGERVGVPVVKQKMGADPASVAFDTLSSATANNADVVIIDTAGRLHNKVGLMNELTKIKNVMKKVVPDAPNEVLLVLDGSTGQNAFEQAKQFTLATEVTAMAVTKLDGTAKGGVVIGISDQFKIPVKYIGLGERVGVPVVKQKMGADPASVAFDTLSSATANNADVVIIDTAGRLHNKVGLMNELTKIKNVMKKVVPDAPNEVLLVLDGSTGQNAFEQAKQFTLATEVTAMAVTKLDGTAKGGVVIGISDQFKIPVKYIGLGEGMEDLQVFRKKEFVDSLFGENA